MKAKFYTFLFLSITASLNVIGAIDTIKAGSYIVNMGVMPQTIGNGLKPYGLVYELLKNHNTPVKWVINSSKAKDGIDFNHNGIDYRGGAFIIPAPFRTAIVNSVIATWEAQGVVGNTTVSDFSIDVAKTLNYAPNWTLDKTNGQLAVSYFINAGIPADAHGGDSSNWKNPSELGACDDIFVLPHSDPSWANHRNLYYWNLNHKGNIWAACHAVSSIENLSSPDSSIQMNFLSTHGVVPSALHRRHSTPPFIYNNPGDYVMQFMGILDGATINGSERSFLPVLGGGWRTTTTVAVADTIDTFIPSLSNGPAGVIAYGKAYGDENRGWVMYEAGHNQNESGTEAEKVAAQRAFFNYSFFVSAERYADFNASISGLEPIMTVGVPMNLSLVVPGWVDLSKYTIEWTSSNGGTFTPADSQNVVYTPSQQSGQTMITVTLKDDCDRAVFSNQFSFVTSLLSTSAMLKGKYVSADRKTILSWNIHDAQINNYVIERKKENGGFVKIGEVQKPKQGDELVFEDQNPGTGIVSYRLTINYMSGIVRYSNIIGFNTVGSLFDGLQAVLNPAKSKITFSYATKNPEKISIAVYDLNGRLMIEKMQLVQPGTTIIEIQNNSKLSGGIYVLRVGSSQGMSSKKLYFTP